MTKRKPKPVARRPGVEVVDLTRVTPIDTPETRALCRSLFPKGRAHVIGGGKKVYL